MIKILAVPGDGGGCAHYRIFNPYWKLGPDYLVAFTYNPADKNFDDADMLVIPRIHTELSLKVMKEFKASGRPVILDFDDNFHAIPWYNPAKLIFYPNSPDLARFDEALELADVVTCSTQTLADAYKNRRDDIIVCPNFISQEHFDAVAPEITGQPKRKGQIRIGYVGSHTHFGDVALLAQPLSQIVEAYQMPKIQLVFFGYPPVLPLQHRLGCEFYPGVGREQHESVSDFMLRYYNEIKAMDLDIALAPLEDNLFNRCKSNIKLLEYGIAGVPVVASHVGPYADFGGVQYPVFAIGENNEKGWQIALSELVEREEVRRGVAGDNLAFIRDHHTTKASIAPWHTAIEKALAVRA